MELGVIAFLLGETFGLGGKLAQQLYEVGKSIYDKLTTGQQLSDEELAVWQKLRLKARLVAEGKWDDE
jgi:hypothetical protein